jgi:hypothetical protein
LSEGTHIFPFEFALPDQLPSSFATPTTSVWYKMEALINKHPKPRREVILFSVRGKLDLNSWEDETTTSNSSEHLKDIRNPISKFTSKTLVGCFPPCCCNCHYISIGLRVPKQGFVPGEKILCGLSAFNETMPLSEVTLSILQVNFYTINKHKYDNFLQEPNETYSRIYLKEITITTKEKTLIERKTIQKVKLPDIFPEDESYRRWEQKITVPKDILITSTGKKFDTVKIRTSLKVIVS